MRSNSSVTITGATSSAPVGVPIGVGHRVRVTVGACLFTSVNRRRADAAQDIDAIRDQFHVARVNTGAIPANVVYLQSFWDRANEKFPCKAMGSLLAEAPIAFVVETTPPQPAIVGTKPGHSNPEMRWAMIEAHRKLTPFVATQPDVTSVTAASIISAAGVSHQKDLCPE